MDCFHCFFSIFKDESWLFWLVFFTGLFRIFNFYTFQNRSSLCAAHSQTSLDCSCHKESLTHLKLHSKKSHAYTDFLASISRTFLLQRRSDCRLLYHRHHYTLFLSSLSSFLFCTHECCKCSHARARTPLTRLLRHPRRFLRLLPSPSYRWHHRPHSRPLLLPRLACPKSRGSGCLVITA